MRRTLLVVILGSAGLATAISCEDLNAAAPEVPLREVAQASTREDNLNQRRAKMTVSSGAF